MFTYPQKVLLSQSNTIRCYVKVNQVNILFDYDENDPLEIAEALAQIHDWEFNRIGEDHIAIVMEGLWRHYFLSLSKSNFDEEMIKVICTFELTSREKYKNNLFEALNSVNQKIWMGSFSYCQEEELIIFRYGITLTDVFGFTHQQVSDLLDRTFELCERYYPVFQMIYSGKSDLPEALNLALGCASGEA